MTPLVTLVVLLLVNPIPFPAQNIGGLYDIYGWAPFEGIHFGNRPKLRADPKRQNTAPGLRKQGAIGLRNTPPNRLAISKETEETISYVEDLLTGRLDPLPDLSGSINGNPEVGGNGKGEDDSSGTVTGDPGDADVGDSRDTTLSPKTEITTQAVVAVTEPKTPGELASPCPGVFSYDRPRPGKERWYGEIRLTTNETLADFNLDIRLDKRSHYLGAWLGEVSSLDNIQYTVQSGKNVIQPGSPLAMKFFVKYSDKADPPRLKSISLNGRQICPKDTGTRVTSNPLPQPPRNPSGVANEPNRQAAASSPKTVPTSTAQKSNIPDTSGVQNQNVSNGNIRPPTSVPGEKEIKSNFGDQLAEDTEFVDGVACGRVEVQPSPLITRGQTTARGQWPWHAAIYELKGGNLIFICGGSLIGIKTILTAAHCVTQRTETPVKPESLLVYLGKYHLKMWTDAGIQGKQVSGVHVHPEYNGTNYQADIAILVLSSPVEFTAYVKPVCLWDRNRVQLSDVEGREGVIVGWGFDENGKVSEELKMATVPVVSQQTCIWSNPQFYSEYSSGSTFCAGFRNGTSACNGDSGGGLVFPKIVGKRENKHQTWALRGIVSLSASQANSRICSTEHYTVFTDVVKFYSWISNYI